MSINSIEILRQSPYFNWMMYILIGLMILIGLVIIFLAIAIKINKMKKKTKAGFKKAFRPIIKYLFGVDDLLKNFYVFILFIMVNGLLLAGINLNKDSWSELDIYVWGFIIIIYTIIILYSYIHIFEGIFTVSATVVLLGTVLNNVGLYNIALRILVISLGIYFMIAVLNYIWRGKSDNKNKNKNTKRTGKKSK